MWHCACHASVPPQMAGPLCLPPGVNVYRALLPFAGRAPRQEIAEADRWLPCAGAVPSIRGHVPSSVQGSGNRMSFVSIDPVS